MARPASTSWTLTKGKIVKFPEIEPGQTQDVCLRCHSEDIGKMHIRRSAHLTGEIGCTSCHSIHSPLQAGALLVVEQRSLCYGCHREIEARFNMPFKHRVNEGAMDCTDCHNPHGTALATWRTAHSPRMVSHGLGNDIACTKCHSDKRGPFVHEHPPVRVEGCPACHNPHGSTNPRLLNRPSAFVLCLECHNDVGGFGLRCRWHSFTEPVVPQPGRPGVPGLRPLSFADPRLQRRSQVSTMRKHCVAFLLLCPSVLAQQPVTLSTEFPANSREFSGYRISNSFEFGYRFANVGGDHDLYRASVNFGDGLRLFQGRLRVNSLDGKGSVLDEFRLRSSGAAGDPYQAQVMRVEKNGLYRYDLQYRLVRYHNRLPSLWRGEHGLTVERAMQTHDIKIFPGSNFEVLLGYDRNGRSGPGFASVGTTDNSGVLDARNYLRYQADLLQSNNQYRAGFTAKFIGLALTATHAIDLYEEEGSQADASGLPSSTSNVQPVEDFTRSQPFHGRTSITTLALHTRKERVIGFNSRFVYAGGTRNSTLTDSISAPGSATTMAGYRKAFIVGDAGREQNSGETTIVLLPRSRWTITNTTAFHNTRIDGDASLVEIGFFRNEYLRFSHLGIRRISNASEASYRALKGVSFYGGYRFSTKRARSSDALRFADFGFGRELKSVDNKFQSGAAGGTLASRKQRSSFVRLRGRQGRPPPDAEERTAFSQPVGSIALARAGFHLRRLFQESSQPQPNRIAGLQLEEPQPGHSCLMAASGYGHGSGCGL